MFEATTADMAGERTLANSAATLRHGADPLAVAPRRFRSMAARCCNERNEFMTDTTVQYLIDKEAIRDLVLPGSAGVTPEAAMARAIEAAQALRAGATVEQVLARYGLTDKPPDDQQYYFAVQYRFGDAFFGQLRTSSDGAVAGPVVLADGIHVVKLISNQQPVPLGFEAARSQFRSDYVEATQMQLMDNTVRFLRRRAKILIAPDYAAEYRP